MAKCGSLPVVSLLQHVSYVSVPACPDPPDLFLITLSKVLLLLILIK